MNNELMKLMSLNFNPAQQESESNRGGSSSEYMAKLILELLPLFRRRKIQSIFDAGCNDCRIGISLPSSIAYYGGDISISMVSDSWLKRSHMNIRIHDVTTDELPKVDLLFIKDVTIHLNNADKKKVIQNWLSSDIPWLLITHDEHETNLDFSYNNGFPFAFVNWELEPWNFPKPTEVIYEVGAHGRCMALWHQTQIKGLV